MNIKRRSAFSFAFPIMIPMGISLFVPWFRFWAYMLRVRVCLGGRHLFWRLLFLQALWSL